MAVLEIKSFEQLTGEMLRGLQSRTGLSDLNTGSVVLSILEAASEADFLITSDIFAALDSIDINRAEKTSLELLANQEGLTKIPASRSSGGVTIADTSFTKLSTNLYAAKPAPIIGSTILYVNDASTWATSGSLYIGRGTINVEGPLPYTSIAAVGVYSAITLASGTNKFHNVGESVILAQGGDRIIPTGTVLNTGVIGASTPIGFNTTDSVTIQDGETEISGVPTICSVVGTTGNVPSDAITEFASPPSPNLTVQNPFPFTNARDAESDLELRDRIKKVRSARSSGNKQSILNAVTNLVAVDEQKRIISASFVEGDSSNSSVLYVDDGTGYEPIWSGIGQEVIIDNAVGGEQFLQLQNTALVKALISTISSQPFEIVDNSVLAVLVGDVLSEHTFSSLDFNNIDSSTAYEIVASINANSELLFSARTTGGGKKVVIFAKADVNESIQITTPTTGEDANDILNFQQNIQQTLKLYKNDNLLNKDGLAAGLTSIAFPWNLSAASYTLEIGADDTPDLSYSFSATELAPYTPATAPQTTWISAFNAKIPGITASALGNKISIASNKGKNSTAKISISGGTLVTNASIFEIDEDTGTANEYSLLRGTGQIKLVTPASEGDTFKAGTTDTRAYVQTTAHTSGLVNITATSSIYIMADASCTEVVHSAISGITVTTSNPSTNIWRYTAPSTSFSNVQIGDWIIIWDTAFTANNTGYFRISNTDASTYIEIEKTTGTVEGVVLLDSGAFKIFHSDGIVQKYTAIGPTNQALSLWVDDFNNNHLVGIYASVADTNKIRLTTNTFEDAVGKIRILSVETGAIPFGFTIGDTDTNNISHIGFSESGNSELGTPLFNDILVVNTSNTSSSAPKFISTVAQTEFPDKMLGFLKTFNSSVTNRFGGDRFNWDGIKNNVSTTTTINLLTKTTLKDRILGDRAYVANSFDLTYDDYLNITIDDSPTTKMFNMPLARTISISSSPAPTTSSFSALDVDGGNVTLSSSFGSSFDFSNYKLYSRARNVVNCDGTNNGFTVKSIHYGPTGEKYNFFLAYPTSESITSFTTSLNVGNTSGGVDLTVSLLSDAARVKTYDGTTSLTVAFSTPTMTFLHSAGTIPNFTGDGVIAGDIVHITTGTSLTTANTGTFRVTNVTTTSFAVTNYNTGATAQTAALLNSAAFLTFYPISTNCTATALVDYINTSLTEHISAVMGVGESGAGLVNRRIRDFTAATLDYVSLVDGQNFVSTASLGSSPQFTTEINFTSLGSLYTLVGEQFKLIPHTAVQIVAFLNSPSISGIANLGELKTSTNGGKIQFATSQLGTAGAVKINGGSANSVGGTIIGNNSTISTSYDKITTTYGATNGLESGQWLKLTSALPLLKNLSMGNSTTATIVLPATLSISGSGAFFTARTYSGDNTTRIQVDKAGDFAAFTYTSVGTAPVFSNVIQGDFVVISSSSNFNSSNIGTFRVIRATAKTFWVENDRAVEEDVILTAATDFKFYSADSILAGDTLVISGSVLGSTNDGTYTVSSVSNVTTLAIDSTFTTAVAGQLLNNNSFNNINAYDAEPSNFYRKINALTRQNDVATTTADIILLDRVSQLDGKFSDIYEFTFSALNKLDFDITNNFGVDGYSTYRGLISEATKVVYGDATSTLFPGYKASGAVLDIRPPLPKRINISVGIRLKTGVPFQSLVNTVKSTIIGVVNSTLIGQSIPLSDVLKAVSSINGILAASIISPTFDSSNDVIVVNSEEKALVLSDSDVSVTLLGN